jgi:hypothetical protein
MEAKSFAPHPSRSFSTDRNLPLVTRWRPSNSQRLRPSPIHPFPLLFSGLAVLLRILRASDTTLFLPFFPLRYPLLCLGEGLILAFEESKY